jgi:p-cumate 2,3-dioxygenase alpha subunit
MAEVSRHICIFPNLIFQDSQTGFRLRQIWPVQPDLIDVLQWDLVPRDEREDLRASRMEYSLAFLGPGGLATPDDAEALEACQRGFGAREVEWSDVSRGMQREPQMNDELQMRSFWRQWHACIRGEPKINSTDDRERSGSLAVNLDA